uniref:Uncharacterized protein n=1 Tax=Globodera pallida TaxID=36090 RepID=A0A183BKT1_GLOPA
MSSYSSSYVYRSPVKPLEHASSLNYFPHYSHAVFGRHSYTFDTFRYSPTHPSQHMAFQRRNYTPTYQTPFVWRFEPAYQEHPAGAKIKLPILIFEFNNNYHIEHHQHIDFDQYIYLNFDQQYININLNKYYTNLNFKQYSNINIVYKQYKFNIDKHYPNVDIKHNIHHTNNNFIGLFNYVRQQPTAAKLPRRYAKAILQLLLKFPNVHE